MRALWNFWRSLTPPQLFVSSFLLLIVAGTLGLLALPGLYTGPGLGPLDALFTATSAVCVTGLIVVDTATYFTEAGQAFLLLLIQFGGLGMIAFTTLIILSFGQRLSLRQEALTGHATLGNLEVPPHRLARDVVRFTLLIEGTGALLLYLLWAPDMGWQAALWPAVFHAVSAFCNAGFSTFSDSLTGFRHHPLVLGVIMGLIVLGGLGFLTLEELYAWRRARRGRRFSLSIHSRLVLLTSGVLIIGGWALFTFFEWRVTLAGMPVWDRLANSLFLSVTARTAGFNTIDYGQASAGTNFLSILLMTVGGSPGSTAGGLKTTTVALLGILAWSRLRGDAGINFSNRSLPEATVQRAVGLFVLAFALMTAGLFFFTATEIASVAHPDTAGRFLEYMFETVSAFNTVGLSMGVTPHLTTPGRWTAVLLMFIGRVGPLTFVAALARRAARPTRSIRLAREDVIVG